ncbi:hypothetical protein EVJ58_g2952 [Rhodofomes roseus]|uniref:DNA 3'-5' helicase n=1 Tax=Rhodofomes roseus TaxID=34475 RepID=A0A4Y9YND8_9APHY|nr:hypothetical protein EVJ58_g2952 [Rhodofomes roseus]
MLVAQAIARDPKPCPKALRGRFKADPCMVVVCPTKALEHDMAAGLTTVVINNDTTLAAQAVRVDLWKKARTKTSIILLSPEQLSTTHFLKLANDKAFTDRLMALTVDEAHLLCSWGPRFRPSFQYIGHVTTVCRFLGLHDGQYHCIRRSNARYDIRWIFRDAQSGLNATEFHELDWVLEPNPSRRVVIFCKTIVLCHRVATYLWNNTVRLRDRIDRIRVFTSLSGDTYNQRTLELLRDGHRTGLQVTVGTDTMAFGLDASGTDDVVSHGHLPEDLNLMLQRAGRIRDGRGRGARAIVYLPRNAISNKRKAAADSDTPATIDPLVARVILAKCKVDEINAIYNNPEADAPCLCQTCRKKTFATRPLPCDCSGCSPEVSETRISDCTAGQVDDPVAGLESDSDIESEESDGDSENDDEETSSHAEEARLPARKTTDSAATAAVAPQAKKPKRVRTTGTPPWVLKVTKKMRKQGCERLKDFRWDVWDGLDDLDMGMVFPEEVLPDSLAAKLFDKLQDIVNAGGDSVLKTLLQEDADGRYVQAHTSELFDVLQSLYCTFKSMQEDTRQAGLMKRRANAEARRLEKQTMAEIEAAGLSSARRSAGRIKIPGGKFESL